MSLHHVEMVMGTAVSFQAPHATDLEELHPALEWLHHVEDTFSVHQADTPVSRYGQGLIDERDLSDEVRGVIDHCRDLVGHTDGVFDPWRTPAPHGSFNPSGYVKGWAIEQAALLLEASGLHDLTINGGGDIAIRGSMTPGCPWTIGIQHPFEPESLCAHFEMYGPLGVATSGTYHRGAHIVDARTGASQSLVSVTVMGPSLTYADVLATTVAAMGETGLQWLQDNWALYDAFAVLDDHTTIQTPGFAVACAAASRK